MRRPRPTIKFLKSLPADSFPDRRQAQQIAGNRWDDLEIGDVRHPLIDDALEQFADSKLPSTHRSATQAAGRPVYELRHHTGAALRAAAVLDDAGDPWIVLAGKHDSFHNTAKDLLAKARSADYMPIPAEYKLRQREEAAAADRQWRSGILCSLVHATGSALACSESTRTVTVPQAPGSNDTSDVTLEFDHDIPPSDPTSLQRTGSMVTVGLVFPGHPVPKLREAVLQDFIPFLEVSRGDMQADYGKNGSLICWITLSQAKLAQLVAAGLTDEGLMGARACVPEPSHLHYVGARYLTDAFVFGQSVRAICGQWFVPTRDGQGSDALPICPDCESEQPFAQRVIDLLRSEHAQ